MLRTYLYILSLLAIFIFLFSDFLSSGLIALAIVILLVEEKLRNFKPQVFQPRFYIGIGIYLIGIIIYLIGKVGSLLILQEFSILVILLAIILLTLGFQYFTYVFWPVSVLIFILSFLETLSHSAFFQVVHFNFQIFTATCTRLMCHLSGISCIQDWDTLIFPHIILYVNQNCSGLNHIVALWYFSFLFTYFGRKTRIQKIFLLFISFPFGIFLNGLRIFFIAIWNYLFRDQGLHGPHDFLMVNTMFIAGTILFLFISTRIDRKHFKDYNERFPGFVSIHKLFPPPYKTNIYLIVFVVVSLLSLYAKLFQIRSYPLMSNLNTLPTKIANWQGQPFESKDLIYRMNQPDDSLNRSYWNETGDTIHFCLAYFEKQVQGKELINYLILPLHRNAEIIPIMRNNQQELLEVNWTRLNDCDIYFWYEIDGKSYLDPYKTVAATIWQGLLKKRTSGTAAMVYVKNDNPRQRSESAEEFIGLIYPMIKKLF